MQPSEKSMCNCRRSSRLIRWIAPPRTNKTKWGSELSLNSPEARTWDFQFDKAADVFLPAAD